MYLNILGTYKIYCIFLSWSDTWSVRAWFSPGTRYCAPEAAISPTYQDRQQIQWVKSLQFPPLFLLSWLQGLSTSLGEFLSLHALWMKMKLLLFHTSIEAYRRMLLNDAVPVGQAAGPTLTSYVQDQHLPVEVWPAPASSWLALCGWN